MTNKKKALTSAATLARAAGTTHQRQITPCQHSTTMRAKGQEIVTLLGHGQSAAVTARELAERLGLTARDVSKLIERLRADGVPVCASCDAAHPGYFLAEGPEELEQYIKSLDRRLLAMRKTRTAMAETLDRETGQQRIRG